MDTKVQIESFYSKSFQRTDKFLVTIYDPSSTSTEPQSTNVRLVRLPTYQLSQEKRIENSGSYSDIFSILNVGDGFSFDITFEETGDSLITQFIVSMIKRMIGTNGVYKLPSTIKYPEIRVEVLDETNNVVITHQMLNCKITNYDPVTLDYSGSDLVIMNVSFVTNEYNIWKGKVEQ